MAINSTDIALNPQDKDLVIESGDFLITLSDKQHIELIFQTFNNDWKEYPQCGLGVEQYLAAANGADILRRDATVQLVKDGFEVKSLPIQIEGTQLTIDPRDLIRIK